MSEEYVKFLVFAERFNRFVDEVQRNPPKDGIVCYYKGIPVYITNMVEDESVESKNK